MDTKKTRSSTSARRNSYIVLLIIIGIVLFRLFVWDVYFANSTVEQALEDYEGGPGIGMFVDKAEKYNLTIKPVEEGFKVYGVSKGLWGWNVTDELLIHHPGPDSLDVIERTFHYRSKKDVHLILMPTLINQVDQIKATRNGGDQIAFNNTVNEDTRLYYYYSEQPIGKVEYKAYSLDGQEIDVQLLK
ncbi:hypothetical protein [Paenibacillus solani]|uniref:Uncharacterized protein n=1 Tax=Paenibacillus solani TaxID=1705565 RepID=A0A0M1P3W9_9BACL|nr:hypothetical protein [Paenibacillus solani]KOR89186.1 hypothetical protein AM231_08435 [Paenibacillus solani]